MLKTLAALAVIGTAGADAAEIDGGDVAARELRLVTPQAADQRMASLLDTLLLANGLAQSQALMCGKTTEQALEEALIKSDLIQSDLLHISNTLPLARSP